MLGMHWSAIIIVCLGLAGVFGEKIIDGREAAPHSRPYMAFLDVSSKFYKYICGGSLIRPDVILTAAHCKGKSITVILGAHYPSQNEKSKQVIPVQEMIPHEEYDDETFKNDIMLLKLKYNATITKEVKTISLPHKNQYFEAGTTCWVAGWGLNVTDGPESDVLREVKVKIQSHCDSSSQICARGTGRKGTCTGDSGGPLVCQGQGKIRTAAGIVSYANSESCEEPDRSNVYVKVSAYLKWIKSKISDRSSA
ncbi:DDN1 protein, partial [Polypterus senegalus]|nr:duodenase-1-like [Polypterus senegalus]MBN3289060.1 DDN1 protein [Polypterus senegalus]